jgi:hypothetical protein
MVLILALLEDFVKGQDLKKTAGKPCSLFIVPLLVNYKSLSKILKKTS